MPIVRDKVERGLFIEISYMNETKIHSQHA